MQLLKSAFENLVENERCDKDNAHDNEDAEHAFQHDRKAGEKIRNTDCHLKPPIS